MRYERKVFDRYLTPREERQLLSHVAKFKDLLAQRDHAWMRLLRYTGIRVGSLVGLTVEDTRMALRNHALDIRPEIAKGEHGYKVPLTQKAEQALKDLQRIRLKQGHPAIPDQPLLMSRKHKGMAVRSVQDRMSKWVRESGLAVQASPHWFRHTLGKRVMQQSTAKDPRGIVQQALGQRSIESTAVYTYPDREEVLAAMEEAG